MAVKVAVDMPCGAEDGHAETKQRSEQATNRLSQKTKESDSQRITGAMLNYELPAVGCRAAPVPSGVTDGVQVGVHEAQQFWCGCRHDLIASQDTLIGQHIPGTPSQCTALQQACSQW